MLKESIETALKILTDAGISAAADPRNLTLPGVWVTIDTAARDRLDGTTATVVVTVVAIASGAGHTTALVELDQLLNAANRAGITDWAATSIRLPNHGGQEPLPAMRSTLELEWSQR